MSKRFLTVILVPDRSTQVRRISIPYPWLKIAAGVLGVLAVLTLGTLIGFWRYRHLYRQDYAMRMENYRYRKEMEQIRSKVVSAETYLERVRRFDQKIRMLTNLEDPDRQVALGPIESLDSGSATDDSVEMQMEGASASLPPNLQAPNLGMGMSDSRNLQRIDDLNESLDRVETNSAQREQSLVNLEEHLKDMGAILRSTPAIWPASGWVTSNFGFRVSPFSGTRAMHEGLDIAASPGTAVKAPADGIVTFIGEHGNYGKLIAVNHGYGTITRYGHLSGIYVRLGDKVNRGQKIAGIGNTGRSTGPHLHYEVVVNGIPRDPRKYILN